MTLQARQFFSHSKTKVRPTLQFPKVTLEDKRSKILTLILLSIQTKLHNQVAQECK